MRTLNIMDYDSNDYDLDDEERYGELQQYRDDETGEVYVINPITGAKVYQEDDGDTYTGLPEGFTLEQQGPTK